MDVAAGPGGVHHGRAVLTTLLSMSLHVTWSPWYLNALALAWKVMMVDLPDMRNDEFHKAEICWSDAWCRPICVLDRWNKVWDENFNLPKVPILGCKGWPTPKIDGSMPPMPRQDMTRVVSTGGRRAVNLNLSTQDSRWKEQCNGRCFQMAITLQQKNRRHLLTAAVFLFPPSLPAIAPHSFFSICLPSNLYFSQLWFMHSRSEHSALGRPSTGRPCNGSFLILLSTSDF